MMTSFRCLPSIDGPTPGCATLQGDRLPVDSGDEREKIAATATRPNDAVAKSERDMTLPSWWVVIANGCCS